MEVPAIFPPSALVPHSEYNLEWEYEGETLIVDFNVAQGITGIPISRGYITLETHPDLAPFKARGIWSDPGVFYKLAHDTPQVTAAMDAPTNAIVSAPYRVEPTELPPWADDEDKAAQARQLEFCQRVFHRWGRNNWRRYCRDVMRTAPISGFYLGEMTADLVDVDGVAYLMPDLPEYRAPWTVREWIHQTDTLRGVKFNFGGTDSWGTYGVNGDPLVVIPIEKLVHIASGQVGSNWEGVSWLRPVWMHIKFLQSALSLWALANQVNALGTLVSTSPVGSPVSSTTADTIEKQANNYVARDVPTIGMPPGHDLKHISPQQQLPDMTPFVIILERMIAMALKNAHSLIALQKAGSYAARADASSEARDGWKFIADEFISNPVETQIFERFIRLNFPMDAAAGRVYVPELKVDEVQVQDPKEVIDAIAAAQDAGLLDHPKYGAHIREMVGLPREVDNG